MRQAILPMNWVCLRGKLRQRFHQTEEPLLWFGLYGAPEELGLDEAKAMLESVAGDGEAAIGKPEFDMDRAAYDTAFARVRDHLAKGDIYQVNLTMRARFRHQGLRNGSSRPFCVASRWNSPLSCALKTGRSCLSRRNFSWSAGAPACGPNP